MARLILADHARGPSPYSMRPHRRLPFRRSHSPLCLLWCPLSRRHQSWAPCTREIALHPAPPIQPYLLECMCLASLLPHVDPCRTKSFRQCRPTFGTFSMGKTYTKVPSPILVTGPGRWAAASLIICETAPIGLLGGS